MSIGYFIPAAFPLLKIKTTICPRSSDPFNIATYYIKWVTTFWTHSRGKLEKQQGKKEWLLRERELWNMIFKNIYTR